MSDSPIKHDFKIWIDADACPRPVKDHTFKATAKLGIQVILVANSYMNTPLSPLISFVQVDQGADVADMHIVDNVNPIDVVITQDIPLAALIIKKGALAINPRGEAYTEDNISERLSVRDFMQELRDSGVTTEGPTPYGDKDKSLFANSLNRIITKKIK